MMKGSDKRILVATISEEYGYGGDTFVAKEFNVSRDTIRKGKNELRTGIRCKDAFNARGCKKTEYHLPNIIEDIKDIVDSQSQTDPKFDSRRLFTRLTTKKVREQLIDQKKYFDEELPTNQVINTMINKLGYNMKKVQKVKPLKKIAETDAIFEKLHEIHNETKDDDTVLRISIDAKATVKIGNYSRNGKSRNGRKALDHDFRGNTITPFGILNVKNKDLMLYFTKTKVTSDFIVDILEDFWLSNIYAFPKVQTLIINSDNGPENSSHRTQFIKRIVEFSNKYSITVKLVYYPPYHSKYNPVERTWAALEQNWNGDLLDSEETVIKFAKTMMWDQKHPTVKVVERVYELGQKLTPKVMKEYEKVIDRLNGLEDWFVTILPNSYNKLIL
jgi:transposase